jgi:Tfp pilus assembly protein PilO
MAIKLTKTQQKYLAVGGVLVIVLGVVYVKFFWSPISKKIIEAEAKITDISGKIDKAKQQAARLPKLEQELITLNEQALEAEKRLPKTKSVPEILVTVNTLAAKARVSVTAFSPGSMASKQYFIELNYPITAKGSFHAIGKFLAALALEERIFNVLNVTYGDAGGGELSVTFTLVSYQYKG